MDIIRKPFLLYPLGIIIFAFILDKILLLENIQTYFSKTMSEINYMQKEELYEDLKNYLKKETRKKVFVYFGTSRALLFDNNYIEAKYPEWTLFNFSVPGGTPDYSLYWLERFKKDKVTPDFVLLDQSIEAYNTAAAISLDDVLTNGLSILFVLRHRKYYTKDQISTLIAKRMFKLYHYRPKLSTIQARVKNNFAQLNSYRTLRKNLWKRLKEGKGSAETPGTVGGVMAPERLKKSAWGDFHSYLVPFHYTENPMYFLGKSFQILKEFNIPHATIWVRLSRPYFQLIKNYPVYIINLEKELPVYEYWYPKIFSFQLKDSVELWNMNEDPYYNCDAFSDAGHMAPACFQDYTDYIFQNINKTLRKNYE